MRKAASSVTRCALRSRSLHAQAAAPSAAVRITTLPNQVRVVTEDVPGHFAGVGLYIDAGSRYETSENAGISHFLDRMAFKSTRGRTDVEMTSAIHSLGGQIQCASTREAMMYQSAHFQSATPLAVSVLADTVINPAFLPEEIELQRDATKYEVRELSTKPELVLPEALHKVAYGGLGLGQSLLCPIDRIDLIDEDMLRDYMAKFYRPERMVLAGAGMPHEELVEQADKFFASLKGQVVAEDRDPLQQLSSNRQTHIPPHLLAPNSQSSQLHKTFSRAASYLYPQGIAKEADADSAPLSPISTYVGGHEFIQDMETKFNHVYLAWEGPGLHSPDIYAMATMQMLLGGGGSFSAGGPGKGMYSRLYTHILNYHPDIDHCEAFHHIYTDSSLIGLFASFLPTTTRRAKSPAQVLPHLVHQISLLLHEPIKPSELSKAKNQLKSSLVMALESRAVEVEDLGRQILVHDRKIPVGEMCDRIDELTSEDIRRVAHRVFGVNAAKPISIVAMGTEDVGDFGKVLKYYGVGGA